MALTNTGVPWEWVVMRDFTAGLWTKDDWLAPAGAATTLQDCYPIPGGGLRAFAKWSTRVTTGIGSGEYIIGHYARGGIGARSGVPTEESDFYIVTFHPGTLVPRLYRWDNTAIVTPTSWTLIKTFAAGTGGSPNASYFQSFYHNADATVHVYFTLQYVGSDTGVWRIRYSDGDVTRVDSNNGCNNLVVFQDRLVVSTGEGNGSRIRYTEPGAHSFSGVLDVKPNLNLTSNRWVLPYAGDLLVAKQGAPMHYIQGDIDSDPVVRQQVDGHYPVSWQMPAVTKDGIAFIAYKEGIYLTQTGSDLTLMSEHVAPSTIAGTFLRDGEDVNLGALCYFGPFLFCPSGHVYDERTGSWFTTSQFGGSGQPGKYMFSDAHEDEGRVHVATAGTSPALYYITPIEDLMDRVQTYTFKSAPMRHDSGRQLEVCDVEVVLKSYANGASCAITVGSTTRTLTGIASGRQKVRALFRERAEILDIQVVPNSQSASVEAPSIEAIKVGTRAGHLTD